MIVVVMAFNFLGDGLRDAADPYGTMRPPGAGSRCLGPLLVGRI